MNCMLSGHVHTLGHIELTQFCQYTGDKLIMILHAIHSPEVETSSYTAERKELVFQRAPDLHSWDTTSPNKRLTAISFG